MSKWLELARVLSSLSPSRANSAISDDCTKPGSGSTAIGAIVTNRKGSEGAESSRTPPGDKNTAAWLTTLSEDERRAWCRRIYWDTNASANTPEEELKNAP